MDIRYGVSPDEAKGFTTQQLRDRFLVQDLFRPDRLATTYTTDDRMLVMGASPVSKLIEFSIPASISGTVSLLERREMGIINLGGPGTVTVDGHPYELAKLDGVYIGRGAKSVACTSLSPSDPARLLAYSGPAHADLPIAAFSKGDAEVVELGSQAECNSRTLYRCIHQNGIKSCNLVMGFTTVHPGSAWNTMPSHTHLRRTEVYTYFDLGEGAYLFHFMGEPTETRHIVVGEGEAVLSPAWSIHAGSGTREYSFVWGMLGENQTFDDMDAVPNGGLL
jgi:4-deoxy-L-threo-5-hexosulose-uronate ketol-isomerase